MVSLPALADPAARDGLSAAVDAVATAAVVLHVRGVVQGVGFRPFVHRLAVTHELGGQVRNESGEVRIELEGGAPAIEAFVAALRRDAPPLARIDSIDVVPTGPRGLRAFHIAPSRGEAGGRLPVSPDVGLCAACEAELFDRANRRYHYPFITCTDCGPRYTVIESMPYDRERTSMRAFEQCPSCLAEYHDPADRRYHSETNSCPACGPRLWLVSWEGRRLGDGDEAVHAAARLLRAGGIVAVRGLGGFHLAVDAGEQEVVLRLRRRKRRDAKPLAVMVRTLDDARRLVHVDPASARLLASRERPIVVLPRRAEARLAPAVAPGLTDVGVMLAYTPLHHLLLDAFSGPLVMTSGNLSDEPIATGNGEAHERLRHVADAFLLHDRDIVSRYDDSVIRTGEAGPVFLRRARGYAPLPVDLPLPAPVPLVAVGAHLKNTFALVAGGRAYISQHIGDLESLDALDHFHATLDRYRRLFHIDPVVAVRDRHPGYLSSRVAEELGLERVIDVQHHHAHIAAVAAEHGITTPVLGLAFDGTGYGDDGHVWGAELLVADLAGYRRLARLRYAPLPGGDLAVRTPWRTLLGYASLEPETASTFRAAFEGVAPAELSLAQAQLRAGLNAPLASSMGRLFDAAAAVLGVRTCGGYEGQAAMQLEAVAGREPGDSLEFPVLVNHDGTWVLDPLPLLIALADGLRRGRPVSALAAAFHESVARAAAELAAQAAEAEGIDTVALGGGVFQNVRLLGSLHARLHRLGLRVLVPRLLSPNDGAISYGQGAVAAAVLRAEAETRPAA
jgi:hydrogenase maturation protein HypF